MNLLLFLGRATRINLKETLFSYVFRACGSSGALLAASEDKLKELAAGAARSLDTDDAIIGLVEVT